MKQYILFNLKNLSLKLNFRTNFLIAHTQFFIFFKNAVIGSNQRVALFSHLL